MTGRNPWVVLGVLEDAPYHEVKREFRRRVKQTHPDNGGDASEFAAVVEAFEVVRKDLPRQHRRCPASATPYDRWVRPRRPSRTWAEDGHPAPAEFRGSGGTWTTWPGRPVTGDFPNVLRSEISKVQAATGRASGDGQ